MGDADGFVTAGRLRVLVRQVSQGPLVAGPELVIQRAAREAWRADTGIAGHLARTHVWCYLLRGRLVLEFQGQRQVAHPGQLVAVPQGQGYRLWVEAEADLEHVIWNATGESPERWWRSISRVEPCILPVGRRRGFERCLEDLVQHLAATDSAERALARPCFELVLGLAALGDGHAVRERRSDAHAERCRDLIESRGLSFRSVRDLAAELKLNPDYLTRIYCARFGASPAEHLRRHRMEHAAHLLQESAGELAEIAAELGFSDAFAFSKAFKAYAGLSPRHWRQQFALRP